MPNSRLRADELKEALKEALLKERVAPAPAGGVPRKEPPSDMAEMCRRTCCRTISTGQAAFLNRRHKEEGKGEGKRLVGQSAISPVRSNRLGCCFSGAGPLGNTHLAA